MRSLIKRDRKGNNHRSKYLPVHAKSVIETLEKGIKYAQS